MNVFFSAWALPVVLIIIMFGIGLSVEPKDFSLIFHHPKSVIIGLLAQMLLLPLMGFLLVLFIDMPALHKVGIVLIAASPGGTASNLVVYLLRGNIALCIYLTVITSLLILVSLPLITNLALMVFTGHTEEIVLPVFSTVVNVFITTLLPVVVGIAVKSIFPMMAKKIEKPLEYIMTILLFAVFAAVIFFEQQNKTTDILQYVNILWVCLALNIVSMAAGYLLSRLFALDNRDSYTISTQVGLQNSALAIYVAASLIGQPQIAIAAVIYSSFSFFSTLLFAWLMKKYAK